MNITPDQVTALVVAITGLIGALTALVGALIRLYFAVHENRKRIVQLSENVDRLSQNGTH